MSGEPIPDGASTVDRDRICATCMKARPEKYSIYCMECIEISSGRHRQSKSCNCVFCGRVTTVELTIEGTQVCSHCANNKEPYTKCVSCGQEFSKEGWRARRQRKRYDSGRGYFALCEKCFNELQQESNCPHPPAYVSRMSESLDSNLDLVPPRTICRLCRGQKLHGRVKKRVPDTTNRFCDKFV